MTEEQRSRGGAVIGTTAATGLIMACGIVTGLIAARSLGPAGRGELTTITIWAATLLYAGTIGLPEAVAYFTAAGKESGARIWWTAQAAALVLGLGITLAGWWLIPVALAGRPPELVTSTQWYLAWFAVPCLGSLCACMWLQGAGRLRAFNVSRASVHLLQAVGMTVLLLAGNRSLRHFAIVLLVANAATWAIAAAYGPIRRAATAPSFDLGKRMAHYGARVQFGDWANSANVRLDQLLLSLFASAASLGLYVVAVSYAGLLVAIPASVTYVMLPEIARHKDAESARASVERWSRRVLWATIAAGLALAALAVVAIPILFGRPFVDAVPVAIVLIPATVILGMNRVFSTAFRGVGRPEVGSTSEMVGLVVTVAALAALLPRFGIYGAGVASLLAYAASHLFLLRKAQATFGTGVRALYLPVHEDLVALGEACRIMTQRLVGPLPAAPSGHRSRS